jgi:DNA modification methylase
MMSKLGDFELNQIYTGDAWKLTKGIPDESVDLIFTDPVYQNIDDYEWLAQLGSRVLKPGKSLLALAGNLEKPTIYAKMCPFLNYQWEAAIIYRGANFFMNSRSIQVSWKPVLWFSNGQREQKWCKDSLIESCQPKEYHRWQQSVSSAVWFIRQLTDVGDIVLDPFSGFGSYQVACRQLSRNFIAFEIENERAEIARQRCAYFQQELALQSRNPPNNGMKPTPQQLVFEDAF